MSRTRAKVMMPPVSALGGTKGVGVAVGVRPGVAAVPVPVGSGVAGEAQACQTRFNPMTTIRKTIANNPYRQKGTLFILEG